MEKKLRVAMFGQKRLSREGGIEIVVKELCTRMARDGCQVTCYNRSGHHVSGAEYDEKIEYVLEFGHLSRDKGTDTLLEVAKKMPNTEFVFIGYGPSADKMKDIPNVKYLGFKTGEELYRIIAEAAISVCPSEWYENCPYSVMESVLLGTPVVGSKMGGIPELIEPGKTGELFEAGNVEELMKAIKKVLQTQDVLERYTKNCSQVNYETTESYYIKLMKIYRGEKNAEQVSS